jgi:alkanesulfonate monooxygenase SsuD/methylene tetrahydromethanopterin reductase-like flavin-dependent oxidoreductase (luciferase family)
VLGLSPGGREDDYEVSGVPFSGRGARFEQQLEELRPLWRGERGVGPSPARDGGPPVLIGGNADAEFRRAARYGDGWTMGGATADMFADALEKLRAAWRAEGRDGEPRTMALFYFVLGDRAAETAAENLGDYHRWLGDYAQAIADSAATDEDTVRGYLSAFEQAGVDEVMCFSASADPAQVELLADAALG